MAVDRYKNMYQTVELVKLEFSSFIKLGYGMSETDWVTELLRNKLDGTPIRAYFLAKAANWMKAMSSFPASVFSETPAQERLFSAQLPFIFEVVITIQYLHNQIFDGKSGVSNRERISRNLLAANLLKDQLYRYIDTEIPHWAKDRTRLAVRKTFESVDQGQYLEQSHNTYQAFISGEQDWEASLPSALLDEIDLNGVAPFLDKLKNDLPTILHEQVDVYFHRIYLTCASLFVEASRLLGDLLKIPARKMTAVLQFSTCYGLMRQLVNDNADWIPSRFGLSTKTKLPEDHFSDLRNATLTLPVLFFLAENKHSAVQQILDKQMCWATAFEETVFQEMIASDALFKSIQNTRILAELALAYLPVENEDAGYLADSCEIVHWNKFLAPCLRHEAYLLYRKKAYRKRTRQLILRLRKERTEVPVPVASEALISQWLQPALPPVIPKLHALLRQKSLANY